MEEPKESLVESKNTDGGKANARASALPGNVLKTRDFLVTGEEFELVRVNEHGLLRTTPFPADLSAYYESDGYISHTDGRSTLFEKLYQRFKKRNLQRKVRLMGGLQEARGRLLDFGAGTGDFMVAAERAGWTAVGVEPDEGARSRARNKGAGVWPDLHTLPKGAFDVITLWHVLEHLPDPGAMAKVFHSRLETNGSLIVAVPNYRSFDARYYGSYWAAYDTPRHLWHFTKESLQSLLITRGFELADQKPMWIDAYYVSWLSEKNRQNPLGPIRAFLVATWSNFLALFTGECSSRIYVFRKTHP